MLSGLCIGCTNFQCIARCTCYYKRSSVFAAWTDDSTGQMLLMKILKILFFFHKRMMAFKMTISNTCHLGAVTALFKEGTSLNTLFVELSRSICRFPLPISEDSTLFVGRKYRRIPVCASTENQRYCHPILLRGKK